MLHTVTGSEEILSKQYAAGGQKTFICPLSKHMIYIHVKGIRVKAIKSEGKHSTQVNKPEIAYPSMQHDYRLYLKICSCKSGKTFKLRTEFLLHKKPFKDQ